MRSHRIVNLGVSGAVLMAGLGVSLMACVEVGPVRRHERPRGSQQAPPAR